uniref:Uncharacterized protein n=1 Tax=Arundo donax TaxID=35708 RepID=A0A0A9FM00_ARUDO
MVLYTTDHFFHLISCPKKPILVLQEQEEAIW